MIKTADIIVCRLINNQVQILLALRSPNSFCGNKWCIPGGHLEENESPLDGCIRELKEETGIDLSSIRNKIRKFLLNGLNQYRNKCGMTYSCLLPENFKYDIHPQQNEISEVRWFDIQKIPYENIAFDHGDIVEDFIKKITK